MVQLTESLLAVVALQRVAQAIVAFAWNPLSFVFKRPNAVAKYHYFLIPAFQLNL